MQHFRTKSPIYLIAYSSVHLYNEAVPLIALKPGYNRPLMTLQFVLIMCYHNNCYNKYGLGCTLNLICPTYFYI